MPWLKLPQLKTLDLAGRGLRQFRDAFDPVDTYSAQFSFSQILQLCRQLG